jgi:hypothetical protein
MTGDRRLLGLAAGQLALGIVAGVLAPVELRNPLGLVHLPIVPLFASALCQALLLALWGATSRASPWKRLRGWPPGPCIWRSCSPPT